MNSVITLLFLTFSNFLPVATAQDRTPCPHYFSEAPQSVITPGQTIRFAVKLDQVPVHSSPSYKWETTAGKIKLGQGSSNISIEFDEYADNTLATVTVRILGLPSLCVVSDTFGIAPQPVEDPLDKFGKISPTDYMPRVDAMIAVLKGYPEAYGLIDLRFTENDGRAHRVAIFNAIKKMLQIRRFDGTRIKIAISNDEIEHSIMWIVPPGAKPPRRLPKLAKIMNATQL